MLAVVLVLHPVLAARTCLDAAPAWLPCRVIFLELVPGWALYRGLYEISQYAFRANTQDNTGITWSSLSDENNGLPAVMVIFAVEAVVFMVLAW